MPCAIEDFLELVHQLDEVTVSESDRWSTFKASGRTFGYLWPRTGTVGLKQTIAEQLALVAERPAVFEKQFTSAGHGWVVVHLTGLDRDELAELAFEAWRLTAPAALVDVRADRLPT